MPETRHTLLIVDDEPDVLASLRALLHRHYRVLLAEDGAEALAILGREDVHLILSDQRMPGLTGDELLRKAREVRPDAIRMVFTGYADMQAVLAAVNRAGIFRYLLKPWDPADLEATLRQAAEQYELLAERRRLLAELRAANDRLTEANRDLAESDALKAAFLEVASHELNTPITIIQGSAELIRLTHPPRDGSERMLLDQIAGSARHLGRLVGAMVKLMRANDYHSPLRPEPTDLAALLREVAGALAPFVAARSLRLRVEVAEDLGTFTVDADKIRDVVTNLLTNAIKFTPDGGEIALEARLVGPDEAEVEVSDRGIGLEPRALSHLFEPFFTEFDPSRHSTGDFGFNQRGLGLGLSLVKKFVELHGGSARAESAPGEGTRISLRLPRRPPAPADLDGVAARESVEAGQPIDAAPRME